MEKRIRVLVARLGLDRDYNGARIIALSFCNAGLEVILCKLPQTPEQIAEIALQEDVNAVTLILLSGAHKTLFPQAVRKIRDKGLEDVLVIGGGIIPRDDIPALKDAGVAAVFTPGITTSSIVEFIKAHVKIPQMKTTPLIKSSAAREI